MSFLKNLFGKKELPIKTNQDFWNWFIKHERAFYITVKENLNVEKDFLDKLSPKLNELREGFLFLTGMQDDHTVELVLTADGIIKNIVFVEELVTATPSITGWKFTALKPAMDNDQLSIEMGGYAFNQEKIQFYSHDLPAYPDEIDITLVHADITIANKDELTNGCYIFLDNFLGELSFATDIDHITVIGTADAEKELIPISKLPDFIRWREKEFIEKYEGVLQNTENGTHAVFEGKTKKGNVFIATINTAILEWEQKASHPWVMIVEIAYDSKRTNGLPAGGGFEFLEEIESDIAVELKDYEGYLLIGHQSGENVREVYYACKDFRKPSKLIDSLTHQYAHTTKISFDIYKDKYWQSFRRFEKEV
ncbi:MAG: DUF695 domain-containing protein [Chitinophagaceae bacterium]